MKVLWVTNIPLPEASILMNEKPSAFGGWLINTSQKISKQNDLQLSIAFPKDNLTDFKMVQGKNINYYVFPKIKDNDQNSISANRYLKEIFNELNPDIVHIYGTEFAHTLATMNICKENNLDAVISIQGLISVCAKHYMSDLPHNIQKRFTFRDFLKQDNISQQQKKFTERGNLEVEAIKKANHIIGRTTWDKACISQINSKAQYHFCNETLREQFYKHKWSLEKCEKYSIFISQASYPIKGLHFMLEAMPLILKEFPKTKLYIAGPNITKSDKLQERLKRTSYAKYIIELIQRYNLKNNIIFMGILDEGQMCERFLKSHVFVSPSTIENESNSLSEAKILGVPPIASYVGGVTDRITSGHDGFLYQYNAPYMLSYYVCEIFKNERMALSISKNARENALKTHDNDTNTKRLVQIYKSIIDKE